MAPRYIGIDPTQVVWANLRIKWWERIIRYSATIAFVVALIIFWAIPTAVVGFISNLDNLTYYVHFIRFVNHVPGWIRGVITGLLPTVLMAVLMALLPIVLRCELYIPPRTIDSPAKITDDCSFVPLSDGKVGRRT